MADEHQSKLSFGFNRGDYMTPQFRELWAPYPNKANPAGAFKAFIKLGLDKLDAERQMVRANIIERSKYDKKWLEGVIPHFTTYLNQKRFLDEAWPRVRHAPPSSTVPGKTADQVEDEQWRRNMARREAGEITDAAKQELAKLKGMKLPKDHRLH